MTFTLFLIFCTVTLIGYSVIPILYNKSLLFSQRRAQKLSSELDRVLPRQKIRNITQMYTLAPLALGGLCFVIFPDTVRPFGVILGVMSGFILPGIYTKMLIARNRKLFDDQLVDALMIMASSFRGGLSLIQAMEAVVEEMPDPINQEFATVLGENKMGIALDEAMQHLYNRMPSNALQQMTTAILLARETGGNLPVIFQRIVSVIRETKRIKSQIDTLTLQGKIQGVVMSMLPVMFFFVVYSTNPSFFNIMFTSPTGKTLLIYACVSEVLGAYMIWKICTFTDY